MTSRGSPPSGNVGNFKDTGQTSRSPYAVTGSTAAAAAAAAGGAAAAEVRRVRR